MSEKETIAAEKPTLKKRGWVVPTITTLIGVAVSLLVAWYQIALSEEQALQAEIERSKAVKNELIQIVEEHVINKKPLDVSRLARLSEFRAKQERLLLVPSVSEIVEGAEFNILKSQYLEFEKKELFKEIFNSIYAELSISSRINYTGIFENSVNDLYSSIQSGNVNEASSKLNKLLSDFNTKIEELNAEKAIREKKSIEELLKIILEKPEIMIIAIAIYAFALYSVMLMRRRARRRKQIEIEFYEEYANKREELFREMHADNKNL